MGTRLAYEYQQHIERLVPAFKQRLVVFASRVAIDVPHACAVCHFRTVSVRRILLVEVGHCALTVSCRFMGDTRLTVLVIVGLLLSMTAGELLGRGHAY